MIHSRQINGRKITKAIIATKIKAIKGLKIKAAIDIKNPASKVKLKACFSLCAAKSLSIKKTQNGIVKNAGVMAMNSGIMLQNNTNKTPGRLVDFGKTLCFFKM